MIVYRFAPIAGSFVQRTVKLVKYLSREGWRATIITPRWFGEILDEDLAREVPAATVTIRAGQASRRHARAWRVLEETPGGWRWVPSLRTNLLYPDYARHWNRRAIDMGRRVLSENDYDVLYSASPPATTHIAAMRLRSEFNLPWVLDFHDPWVDNEQQYERIWRARKMLDRRLEAKVLQQADYVGANTRAQQRRFVRQGHLPSERIVWTPCGYDEEDFVNIDATARDTVYRITYTGSFYYSYNPRFFFECLSRFLREHGAPEVRVTLTGKSCDNVDRYLEDPCLRDRIERKGYISREEIPRLLAASQMLFLTTHPGGRQVPAKFYEYLRSGRPIIATGDTKCDVSRILAETGRGRFFYPNQGEQLIRYLLAAYERWRVDGECPRLPPDASIRQFEMCMVARRFAEIFERASELRADRN